MNGRRQQLRMTALFATALALVGLGAGRSGYYPTNELWPGCKVTRLLPQNGDREKRFLQLEPKKKGQYVFLVKPNTNIKFSAEYGSVQVFVVDAKTHVSDGKGGYRQNVDLTQFLNSFKKGDTFDIEPPRAANPQQQSKYDNYRQDANIRLNNRPVPHYVADKITKTNSGTTAKTTAKTGEGK
jgi:hypothetical protein